ncbi:MAG: hypothetical protein HOL43_07450 [Verrucomicrobiales bacterium]|nr:hypothetical protein [Verrucomicrobiales bacterium]
MKRQYIALLILLPFLVVGGLQLWRATQPAPALILEEAAKRPIISLPERKIAKRFRHVKLHPDALQDVREGGRIIELELFPGETVRIRLEDSEYTSGNSTEVMGEVVGVPRSLALFVTVDDALAGTVELPDGRQFLVNYAGNGEHSVVELDPLAMQTPHALQEHFAAKPVEVAPDADAAIMPALQWGVTNRVNGFSAFTHVLTRTNPWPTQVLQGAVNWGPPIISIMILYTPEAKKQSTGLLGIETRARLSVAQVNAAFRRSGITAKLVLAHLGPINYRTSGNLVTDLKALTYGTTLDLYNAHLMRQQYRADLVSLFVGASPGELFHGTGWMITSFNPAPSYGMTVMEGVYAPTSVFAHEIGHNLGCQHATNDIGSWVKGAFTNSNGMRFNVTVNGQNYPMRTIMAYGAGPRLGYFSNPNINVWGSPTGNTNSANNAWTIQQTAPMVGNYLTQIIQAKKLTNNASSQRAVPINRSTVRWPAGGFNGN